MLMIPSQPLWEVMLLLLLLLLRRRMIRQTQRINLAARRGGGEEQLWAHPSCLQSIQTTPVFLPRSLPFLDPEQTWEDVHDLMLMTIALEQNITLQITRHVQQTLEILRGFRDRSDLLQGIAPSDLELRIPDSGEARCEDPSIRDQESSLDLFSFHVREDDSTSEVQNFSRIHLRHHSRVLFRTQMDPRCGIMEIDIVWTKGASSVGDLLQFLCPCEEILDSDSSFSPSIVDSEEIIQSPPEIGDVFRFAVIFDEACGIIPSEEG